MAIRSNNLVIIQNGSGYASWSGLLLGDSGEIMDLANYADRSVQATGAFGASGAVTIQGSNDGVIWATLKDAFGNALVLTAASIAQIMEITRFIRPSVATGDGTTNLAVTLFALRSK